MIYIWSKNYAIKTRSDSSLCPPWEGNPRFSGAINQCPASAAVPGANLRINILNDGTFDIEFDREPSISEEAALDDAYVAWVVTEIG